MYRKSQRKSIKTITSIGFDAFIYFCGCLIKVNEQVLYKDCLSIPTVNHLLDILQDHKVGYNLEDIDNSYLDPISFDFFHQLFLKEQNMNSELDHHYMNSIRMLPIKESREKDKQQIVKLAIFSEDFTSIKMLGKDLPEQMRLIIHSFPGSTMYNREISQSSITKATGIEKVLHHYQIEQEDSIGISDSLNDLKMIRFCAIGVAMKMEMIH